MPDKPYILAVDDDPQVLRQVTRDLKRHYGAAYQVLAEESGARALEVLDELSTHVTPLALVLSDQRMDPVDGVRVLQHARGSIPGGKRVMLTAYADTDAAIAAINRSQIDYYLTKPWDPPDQHLYPVLDDLLDDWRARHRPGYGGARVYGSRWEPRVHEVRDLLGRSHYPFQFVDIERPEGRAAFDTLGLGADALPLVILPDGEQLVNPTTETLATKVGLKTGASATMYDFAIVGAGPAGLAAAVYGASEGLSTVLIDAESPGGQAGTSSLIENYLGFPQGLSGADLARRAVTQAKRFQVEVISPQRVDAITRDGPYTVLRFADDSSLSCKALLLATGVSWRRLDTSGMERLTGRGVYYGAVNVAPDECAEQDVFVVGAGNSAGQAAVDLAKKGARVTMVVRGSSLGDKMSQYLVTRITASGDDRLDITVLLQTEVSICEGGEHLERVTLHNRATGEESCVPARYMFVFIGAAPNTTWLGDLVGRDDHGFILTGPDLAPEHLAQWPLPRPPSLFETSVPGIYAAGDVRHESIKRVASAVGEGSVVVHFVHRHLASF